MDDEDEDFVCYSCGDDIPCCHMDDVPLDLRLCDGCMYTALLAARARIARVEAVLEKWNEEDGIMPNRYVRDWSDCASDLHSALRDKP